jgi:hypothetical protein
MRKFTESISSIKKVESKKIVYYDLFPLLDGLEGERPGIRKRVWEWLCDEDDAAFKVYNGRIKNINLFYFGIGTEYETEYSRNYPQEIEHCKKTFTSAFIEGPEKELRLDFNLIISLYENEVPDIESFPVLTRW